MASLENVWGAKNEGFERVGMDRFSAEALAKTLPGGRVFIPCQEAFKEVHEETESWVNEAEQKGKVNPESIRRLRADLAYTKSLAKRGNLGYFPNVNIVFTPH